MHPQVIFFTQTWFNEESDTSINGYQLLRADRRNKEGGNAIYVKSEILPFDVALTQLKAKDIEQIWTIIRYGKDSILLGSIYRPHDLEDEYLSRTIETIKTAKYTLKSLKCTNMLLYGISISVIHGTKR